MRHLTCCLCGFFAQTIDYLIWSRFGYAHRQCSKGRN
jgi:hypothetical protein